MTPIPIPVHIVGATPTPSDMLSPSQYLNYEASSSSVSYTSIITWAILLALAAIVLYALFHMYKDVICPKCPPCVQKLASRYIQSNDKD